MIYIVEMSGVIKKSGINFLEVKLADILSCLPFTPEDLKHLFNLKIFFLEGVGKLRGETAVVPLSEKINKSKNGFKTTYPFLMELSEDLDQILEIFFVAHSGGREINKHKKDGEYYQSYDYTFELCDGSFWIISCKDIKYVKALQNKFRDVSVTTHGSVIRGKAP